MRKRQTFTLSDDLLKQIAEFRWRNRVPSLSRALDIILRRAMTTMPQTAQPELDDPAQAERQINNHAYSKMKAELGREREGTFVVIALGRLQGYATTLGDAYELLKARAPQAEHAIIEKIGEKVEAEAVWEAIGERIS